MSNAVGLASLPEEPEELKVVKKSYKRESERERCCEMMSTEGESKGKDKGERIKVEGKWWV